MRRSFLEKLARYSDDYSAECLVPTGSFSQGCSVADHRKMCEEFDYHVYPLSWFDDETPQRRVFLSAYYIDRYPITNAQFALFVLETGYETVAEQSEGGLVFTRRGWEWVRGACWYRPTGPRSSVGRRQYHPVCQISWRDAHSYAAWRSKRLPTESEWEKACRGTDGRRWPWSNEWKPGVCGSVEYHAKANFNTREEWRNWWESVYRPHLTFTKPVGSYPRSVSVYGIHDMVGCLYQWVEDWYGPYSRKATYRGEYGYFLGRNTLKVVRGGCWMNFKFQVRTCERMASAPLVSTFVHGFRCARTA
ncbi:MAG: hypothetical protein G01um101438_168 [Parcubacteria group bacterium Gr01-1014_38]|nr:MAG: hypothetical protein G01um101438_168 [Parcubacteria group bacterium Gr01-1014_38]